MTELTAKRDEVKRQIRSLLESAPLGLTLSELKRDFKIFIGTHLPTRNLGYHNDEEFLNDISDVVKVTWKGSTMVLTAVSGKETQHLVKMINRQKIDCKKNWGVLKCASRAERNPLFAKPPPVNNHFFTNAGSNSLNWRSPPYANNANMSANVRPPMTSKVMHRSPPCVPAFVRGQIFNLIKNKPEGLPLIYFKSVYRKSFGVSLDPQSLGFADEEALLANLPEIVELKKFGSEIRVMLADISNNGSNKIQHIQGVDSEKNNTTSNKQKFGSCGDSLTCKDKDEACIEETDCNIPPVFQNYVRKILSKYPNGISSSRLPSEFKAAYKSDLPVKTYGYNSVIEFVSDLPHIVHIERPQPQGDWILYPAELKPDKKDVGSEHKDSCDESDLSSIVVDQGTKDSIIQVLAMQKDGIALHKFQDVYKEMTGKALDVKEYNARSVKQLLLSLSDILLISICPKDKYRLHLRDSISVRKFDKLSSNYQPLLVPENEYAGETLQLPSDVVGPGCFFKPQPIPKIDNEHRYINLYISYVLTPSVFWIQLRGKETTVALEDLMDDLEKVYDSKKLSKDYMITAKTAKVGMVCAAIFPEDNFWYRAVIKDIKDPYYEVLYIDYGNVCSVTLCQLRLLKAKFLKLPAQAIQARLSHCQPVGETWDVRARDRLLSLSKDKPLFGLVTDIRERVISVCLIDTSEENKDIHINDVLCHEGYSRFVADNQPASVSTPNPNSELVYGAVNPEKSPKKNCVYVRQVQMTDRIVMNLINLDSHPFLLSFEISSLFFKEDIIGSKLRRDNVDVKKIIVNKANYPDLFEELLLYDVANFNEQSNMLSLFSLSGFPVILKLYGKGKEFEEIKETAQELINWFDPEDKYWKGEDDIDSESCSTQDDLDSVSTTGDRPSMDELKMALQTLNIQRKRILHNMMTTGICGPESVNEIDDVETKIAKVEDYMKKLEMDTTLASSAFGHYMATSPQELSAASQNKSTQKVAPIIHSPTDGETLVQNSTGTSSTDQMNALLMEQQNMSRNREALLQSSVASSGVGQINTVLLEQQNINRTGNMSTLFPSVQQSTLATSSVNPGLVNQQLLALLQQQMLQTQLQQSALGMQSLRSSVSPTSLMSSLTPAGSGLNFLPNEQLVRNTLLVQNQRLQQQQLNAFNAALASLNLGYAPSSNLSELINVPSSNLQLGVRSAVYHGAITQNSSTAAPVGLTPAQQSQLRQLQQLQNLVAQSSVTTSR